MKSGAALVERDRSGFRGFAYYVKMEVIGMNKGQCFIYSSMTIEQTYQRTSEKDAFSTLSLRFWFELTKPDKKTEAK